MRVLARSGRELVTLWILMVVYLCSTSQGFHPSSVHRHMSKRDLAAVFGVDSHDDVPEYDITSPVQISKDGKFIAHELSYQRIRERRDFADHHFDDIYYKLRAFGSDFHLNLVRNRRLLAPDFQVEVIGRDGRILKRHTMENCHFTGKVRSSTRSTVAMSNCQGLRGLIHTEEGAFFVEPLPAHLHSRGMVSGRNPHVIYRRDLPMNPRNRRVAETKELHSCGTEDDPSIRLVRALNDSSTDDDRSGPAGPGAEKYIESLVVVDPKMANFHGEDAAKQYALAACNIAGNILRDSSLGENPINLVVSRMQILTTQQPGLIINHHASNTLESFGKWAERNNNPLDNDENHYDYATLFTRYNICKDKNQPCDTLGLARTRGMCSFPSSASVNQDNGLMLGMTLAHETGHSMGINHDGGDCADGENVMSTFAPGKPAAFSWSSCSRNYLKQFLASDDSKCLDDQPTRRSLISTAALDNPGRLYDKDQQCQLAYGQEAKFCSGAKFLDQVCVKLWCEVPAGSGQCKTAQVPATDGTSCGEGKWCKRGHCVASTSEGDGAMDGGWSEWSENYSRCSRSCGGGVQYRERRCNKPQPKNGGKHCAGADREYKLCNVDSCSISEVDFRNYQCQEKDSQMFNDQYYNWEFKPSTLSNRCILGCFIKNTGLGFAFGNVVDGTDCSEGSPDKCIMGQCKRVGCDGVIDSRAVIDRCGVCDGDGSSCTGVTDTANNTSSAQKKDALPHGGGLLVTAISVLKNLGYDVDRRGHVAKPDDDRSNTDGDDTFYWAVEKTGCSVSCGGGAERSYAQCRRSDDGSPVAERKCDVTKKPPRQEMHCNRQPCPPVWKAEGWEDCTRTCNGGNRTRQVKCMQVAADGVEYDVDQRLCLDPRPPTVEACNTVPCLPEWVAQPFGPCSTVCGRGEQTRTVKCMKADVNSNLLEVPEAQCDGMMKPPLKEYCNVHNPCPGEGGCGGELKSDTGELSSPNFPANYPNNKECIHSISVSPGKVIKLDFHTMQMASPAKTSSSDKCSGDFVKVMDGECGNFRSETLFCGQDQPAPFISTGNNMCVKFFSDESQSGQGFKASFSAINRPSNPGDQCGAILTAPIGLITSPNYPESYPGNELCNMTIKVDKGPIKVAFQSFDIGTENNCDDDYLMFHDNTGTTRRLCGGQIPDAFSTDSNEMKLSFRTGPQIGRTKSGFVATYTSGTTPEELRKISENAGIKTFTNKMDQGLMNVPVAKNTIPKPPQPAVEMPHDIDVNFKPISKVDNQDAAKSEVEDAIDSITKSNDKFEDAVISSPTPVNNKLKDALKLLDASDASASGSGVTPPASYKTSIVSGEGEKKAGQSSGSVTKVILTPSASNDASGSKPPSKAAEGKGEDDDGSATSDTESSSDEQTSDSKRVKLLQETIDNIKKQGLLEDVTGSIITRGSCPVMKRMSCLNLLYSFPCRTDDDCFESGMKCCPTRCSYGKTMCIPRVSAVCPLRTPYYTGFTSCKDSSDCGKGAVCCLDMAGRHYCNRITKVAA
ncbi:A disintegrin and metalloproteinase with thrombospondin motifs 6 isoform X2 [Nematostella vectensis]|uniref:A disintegrin and metalloproteinase with thrombospondin motifs 6 isoform X2 n=1 Tax=Nematostella vectensis TaxID=45351 RepID=UPI002076D895|nr:A disintegrin and metalloproteinase with thrombospondin motifs 6 isoform X2 [Nematostella vectensis]XP_048587406.1 A disintegrin and metalloproteinase with thrombospondin motifs 6 isoform X2 [Nematostella vectensis]